MSAIDWNSIKDELIAIGWHVCRSVHESAQRQSNEERSAIVAETAEDEIFQIDRDVEHLLVPMIADAARRWGGVRLIAEGVGDDGELVLPEGLAAEDAALAVSIDPIDGSRGIMYDKRSAFFLAGAAPNRMPSITLQQIQAAVMVELPTSRSDWSDVLWAVRGQGAHCLTRNLYRDEERARRIAPSRASSIYGGFAQISRFFPPGRDLLAQIEEETLEALFPDAPEGRAIVFNDQYISTGGQLYELLMGRDRFVADIRSALYGRLGREGKRAGMTCHPYDVCAHLIGDEAGLIVTDIIGNPLDPVMDLTGGVDWIAYANPAIRDQVQPVLTERLRAHGLID